MDVMSKERSSLSWELLKESIKNDNPDDVKTSQIINDYKGE